MAAEFPFGDLREYINFLEDKGELVRVKAEVDIRGEIATIARRLHLEEGPAALYENIRGFPGWRVASNLFSTPERRGWSSGLSTNETEWVHQAAGKLGIMTPPMVVESGPCKELKFHGAEIDLTRVPWPWHTPIEGTPHFPAGIEVIQDRETGWINLAIRWFGVKGPARLGEYISPIGHFGMIWTKYRLAGEPMPISWIVGTDPCVYYSILMKPPAGICEYDLYGGFAGQPIQLVKCETNDLLVPANAEMVIEGVVHPFERELTGPHHEYTGFNQQINAVARIDVTCVTMRKDPIIPFMNMGEPPTEGGAIGSLTGDATMYAFLTSQYPGVLDVYNSNFMEYIVVQVDKRVVKGFPDLAKRVAFALKFTAAVFAKTVIVVDDDCDDIRDLRKLMHFIYAKYQPSKDVTIIEGTQGVALDPSEPWSARGMGSTDFMVIDATEPPPPYDEIYMRGKSKPTAAMEAAIDGRWKEYGFENGRFAVRVQ